MEKPEIDPWMSIPGDEDTKKVPWDSIMQDIQGDFMQLNAFAVELRMKSVTEQQMWVKYYMNENNARLRYREEIMDEIQRLDDTTKRTKLRLLEDEELETMVMELVCKKGKFGHAFEVSYYCVFDKVLD